jgi:hypothetical protein
MPHEITSATVAIIALFFTRFLSPFDFDDLIARVCLETTLQKPPRSLGVVRFHARNLKHSDNVVCAEIGFLAPFLVLRTNPRFVLT